MRTQFSRGYNIIVIYLIILFQEGNKTLKEQLRSHEILLEQQKELKRKTYEESVREHEEYLKDQRLLCEKKKQFKCQFRKDLNDQINSRNVIIVSD